MVEELFYKSLGIVRYDNASDGTKKLFIEIDKDISNLARTLAPKYLRVDKQKFAPHISVVRHEQILNDSNWGKYEGVIVPFEYGSYVYDDGTYFWIRVRSRQLIDIRLELGLQEHSKYSMPPDYTRWFHITVGNTKRVQHL